jgi:hypothetical protein
MKKRSIHFDETKDKTTEEGLTGEVSIEYLL